MKRSNLLTTLGLAVLVAAGCSDDTASAPVATYLTLSSPGTALLVGDTIRVTAQVQDGNHDPMSGEVVSYSSNDPSVATVDAQGLVTALAAGAVTITGSDGNARGALDLTVAAPSAATDGDPAGLGPGERSGP